MLLPSIDLQAFTKQLVFIATKASFPAFVGGVGSGKTRAGAMKALAHMAQHPGSLGIITAPTFPMLRDATLRTIQELFPGGHYELNKADMVLRLSNGAEALLRSTDDPDRLRGPNAAWFWMDEAAQSAYEAWLVLQGRLRQSGQTDYQGWVTTTPKGYNWVYTTWGVSPRPGYELHPCSTRDNPYLPPDFIAKLEASYSAEFQLQEIEGQFVPVSGRPFFHIASLQEMLKDCQDPREERYGGLIKIWKPPAVAGRYVAFGDCAWGEKGSYSCTTVWDWQTGEQMAELHGRPPLEEAALRNVELGRLYNDAYTGIEANGEGKVVVNKMVDLGYGSRMYHREDDWETEESHRAWITSGQTRPVMLGNLAVAVRELHIRPRCRDMVQEMLSFVRADSGRPQASEGCYSDHVMSAAGAWAMRDEYHAGGPTGYTLQSRPRLRELIGGAR